MEEYLQRVNRSETSILFKARTRMIDVANNFRTGNAFIKCRACRKETETQNHVLNECAILHSNNMSNTIESVDLRLYSEFEMKKLAWQIQRKLNQHSLYK